MKILKILILLCVIIHTSCTFVSTNSESDKQEAQLVVDSFYSIMKNKSYTKSFSLFSDDFFKSADTNQLKQYYAKIDSSCGAPINYKVSDWGTKTISGTTQSAQYYFVNNVQRERCSSQETISLMKKDGKILIVGYDAKINIAN